MNIDAHLSAVPLQSWLRIQREAPPLGGRAEALRQALLGCPQVRQAWYLTWQPASRTYAQVDDGPRLPPGMGDPLEASDETLFTALGEQASLTSGKIPAAIHVCPEAFDGGPLARVRDGDLIRVDGQSGELLLQVDEAEFAAREPAGRPAPASGCGRELFAFMRHNFSTAEQGASAFTESLESLV